jgi:hypothetical protein
MALSALVAPRAAAQKAPPAPQDVHVVNASADPVPVKIDPASNTVRIDGTANGVKAAQAGAWSVGITGTPVVTLNGVPTVSLASGAAVQIGNTASSPALVRDVDRPFSQPFRASLTSFFTQGSADTTVNNSVIVPATKRLIIEFVTVKITMPNGQAVLFAKLDATAFDQYITLTAPGNDSVGNTFFVATHKVFMIFDPGQVLQAAAFRNTLTGGGNIAMTISGYLVDTI